MLKITSHPTISVSMMTIDSGYSSRSQPWVELVPVSSWFHQQSHTVDKKPI